MSAFNPAARAERRTRSLKRRLREAREGGTPASPSAWRWRKRAMATLRAEQPKEEPHAP